MNRRPKRKSIAGTPIADEDEIDRDSHWRWWRTPKANRIFLWLLLFTICTIFIVPRPENGALPDPPKKVKPIPEGYFRVAALQYISDWGKPEVNREALAKLIRNAAAQQAQVVVMPEAAIPGYLPPELKPTWRDPGRRSNPLDGVSLEEAGVAESVPGPSSAYFGVLARELNLYIVVSIIEKAKHIPAVETTPGRTPPPFDYFNTALLIDPQGEIICHYRKLNPWPPGEATWAEPGNRGIGICDTPFGRMGVLICYDLSSKTPETLIEAGATTLLYPIGWVCPNPGEWFGQMLPEKVRHWDVNLVGANWSLREPPRGEDAWLGFGYSSIIRRDGLIVSAAGAFYNEVVIGDLPLPERYRSVSPSITEER